MVVLLRGRRGDFRVAPPQNALGLAKPHRSNVSREKKLFKCYILSNPNTCTVEVSLLSICIESSKQKLENQNEEVSMDDLVLAHSYRFSC